ncbi:LacI family DNA-binding transcriptional regulator [Vannielia litorea]|uniref:LacI family DNA-binding transcriptional regulator n=1 Tax=Vannielia TaxID=2813041 RepID=UPI001C95D327|nr:substrate-binding domain-containing protein [Vannielia litorea]MBY6047477.1 substrate-binding domain-containing protein [Vannielia litorea]MBY6074891.1 substrate-binding domain-containing protein [Vannielia litorea]
MNLKELAANLGLSQTTVSRALNGYPEVNEDTRKRVIAAASQHNYRPNTRAQSLATGRSMAIGHVIPISTNHEMMNPVFGDFIGGAGEIYARAGYDMMLSVVPDDAEDGAYRSMAQRNSVDGIVIHGPRRDDPRIALLKEVGLPFIVHGRAPVDDTDYSYVDVNNRRAFERATLHLADLGHTRMALLNGLESMDFAIRRREGFEAALKARGLPFLPQFHRSEEMTESYGYQAAREMLAQPDPPTAFLVSSLITAMGVRRAVEERGLQMGRDISIITHDDDLGYFKNGGEVPVFTATRSSVREAGRITAEMLLGLIDTPQNGPRQHIMEADLTLGLSTGPAPR